MSHKPPYSDFDDEPTMAPGGGYSALPENTFPHPINARYRCRGILGKGSSGAVYKAFDSQLQREVAIKFIHRHQHEERTRLLNEARVLAQLEHPHICKVYEVAEEGEAVYLVMSFINGPHLNVWREQFSNRQLVQTVADIAGALHSAHLQGIVHCDVKPSNIVLRQSKDSVQAVLVDFGIAHGGVLSATISGVGTQHYMAPERLPASDAQNAPKASVALSPAIDIYALGATLRFVLTGSHAGALQTLDTDLKWIIAHCLEEDPAARYANAHTLQQDLLAWLDRRPISLRRSPIYRSKRLWQRSRWFRGTSITTVALALVAIVSANVYQNTLNQRQLEQHNIGEQVVQREYQIESIYRSPLHPISEDLAGIRSDAQRWYAEAASHPDWLAATQYAAAGRLFYQLYDNENALASLQRAWQLGDRSDRTATTYALTLNRFHFEAQRQARTLPSAEAREEAHQAAYATFAVPAIALLDQAERLQLPRDYIRAMRLYFEDQPHQALTLLRSGQFPNWFYQRYELMLEISDELTSDVLDGFAEGDYLALNEVHEYAYHELIRRVPSYLPAYTMRAGLLFALQVGRENQHQDYNPDANSWIENVPDLLANMAAIDPQHPEYLFSYGRYHTLLSYRPHLTEQDAIVHLSNGARYLEQSLRYSNERDWPPEQRIKLIRGALGLYINFINYMNNNGQSAQRLLARYQTILDTLPDAYRGHDFYMNMGNAYAVQARQASTFDEREYYYQLADEAYIEGRKRAPGLPALEANHARVLNAWAGGQALHHSITTNQRAVELISRVSERLPENIAVLYNYAVIHIDHASSLALTDNLETAAEFLHRADQAMATIGQLSPQLDIARQRWADIYLFYNHLLTEPLSPEVRYEKVANILSLSDFDATNSTMSYVRYLELLLQEHERTQDTEALKRVEDFISEYFLGAEQTTGTNDVSQALTYLSLHTNDPAKSEEWRGIARKSLKSYSTELNPLSARDSATILSAHLIEYLDSAGDQHQDVTQNLATACAASYDLFEQGYIKDVYLNEVRRIWRVIGVHTPISCVEPEVLL